MIETGNLQDFKISDLINIIIQSNKTVELSLNSRGKSGSLYFNNGNLDSANTKSEKGDEAAYEILSWEKGTFQINENIVNNENNINTNIESLLDIALKNKANNTSLHSKEEKLWYSLKELIEKFHEEFTSISGLKMTNDLNNKIVELISTNDWKIKFKNGKIYSNEILNYNVSDQLKIYNTLLSDLLVYFEKTYGKVFINRVLGNVNSLDPMLKNLIDSIIQL